MDNQTKLEIAQKKIEAQHVQTQQEKETREQFATQLECFVGDLNRILSGGINIVDVDKLDSVSDTVEQFGVEAVNLVERIALCIDRFSELTIPEHIELKTDQLILDKLDSLNVELPEDLTRRLLQLDSTIVELSKALKTKQLPSKNPQDFQPVRIVLGDEGNLTFLKSWPMPVFSGSSSGGVEGGATEDKQDQIIENLEGLRGFQIPEYDEIDLDYTGDDLTGVQYKFDGATVATLTLSYSDGKLSGVVLS